MKALELFERIVFSAKRLVLDHDLSDDEAKEIASATDKVNKIRGRYTDRKLRDIFHRDNSEGKTDNA